MFANGWGYVGLARGNIKISPIIFDGFKQGITTDTIESIRSRRAVKYFDSTHEFSEQKVEQLLSLATLSPTAYNIQNWRFVVVTNKGLRKNIRVAAWDQTVVTDALLLVVLCADLKSWGKCPDRYWANAPEDIREALPKQPYHISWPIYERLPLEALPLSRRRDIHPDLAWEGRPVSKISLFLRRFF